MANSRICTRCGIERPIEEFQKVGIRDYVRRVCRHCIAAYQHGLYFGNIKPLDRGSDTRKCRRCGEVQPLSNFPVLRGKYAQNGWQKHTCIACDKKDHAAREAKRRKKQGETLRAKIRERNAKNRESRLKARKEKRLQIKREVLAAYGGQVCKCCGETCWTMLTVDHINNDGNVHRKFFSDGYGVDLYAKIKQAGFPDGYQILCYNCNISKYRNNGVCQHHSP